MEGNRTEREHAGEEEREGRRGDGMEEGRRGKRKALKERRARERGDGKRREMDEWGRGGSGGEGGGGGESEGPGCLRRCVRTAKLSLCDLGNQPSMGPPTTCKASSFPPVPSADMPGSLAPRSLLGDTS